MKRILASAAVAGVVSVLAMAQSGQATYTLPRKAPELAFHIPGQPGEKLLSQYRGKVVALEFILTTCPHCQHQAHVMTDLIHKYGSQGLDALDLAINALDENPTPASADQIVSQFQQTYQVGFPVGWVQRDAMATFMSFSLMDRTVVPQIALIDRKGMIRYQTPAGSDPFIAKDQDLRDPGTLEKRIVELLSEKSTVAHHAAARAPMKKAS